MVIEEYSENVPGVPDERILELRITDREMLVELYRQPEQDQAVYALSALRLGLIALRQARGELDSASIRRESDRLMTDLRGALTDHSVKVKTEIGASLAQYFDPSTGNLTARLERLVKNGGDLDAIILRHLNGDDGTLARALVKHVGEGSPIFKLLSPDEKDGLVVALETAVKQELAAQRTALAGEFSLDSEDSALSRLKRELTGENGKLKNEFQENTKAVMKQFSLDEPNSALSRLVGRVERAHQAITQQFSLDDESSSLSKLKRNIDDRLEVMSKNQQDFHAEVRATLAAMTASKRERSAPNLHGTDFEQAVEIVVADFAARRGHVHEVTSHKAGRIPRCMKGDFKMLLSSDSIASGAALVVEAKEDTSYTVPKALKELEIAKKNRDAEVSVFVFSARTAPSDIEPLARHGRDVLVVWDVEDRSLDAVLDAALCLAVCLCTDATGGPKSEALDVSIVDAAIKRIASVAKDCGDIRRWAETMRSNSTKIVERTDRMEATLESECRALTSFLETATESDDEDGDEEAAIGV